MILCVLLQQTNYLYRAIFSAVGHRVSGSGPPAPHPPRGAGPTHRPRGPANVEGGPYFPGEAIVSRDPHQAFVFEQDLF